MSAISGPFLDKQNAEHEIQWEEISHLEVMGASPMEIAAKAVAVLELAGTAHGALHGSYLQYQVKSNDFRSLSL